MKPVDATLRAELSRIKVQLHQVMTALHMSIGALDIAFKSTERLIESLSTEPHRLTPGQGKNELDEVRNARAQILNMRTLLR